MHTRLRATLLLGIIAATSACQGDGVTAPQSTSPSLIRSSASAGIEQVLEVPVNLVTFVSCAMGGAGEQVVLSGSLVITSNTTVSRAGRATVRTQFSPRNVVGSGMSSGDTYRGNGVTISSFTVGVGQQFSTVNNFQVIGQGPGNNFRVHEVLGMTVNANGTITAQRLESRTTCG